MKVLDKSDKRIPEILTNIGRFASGDFGQYLTVSDELDEIDAIRAGMNELGDVLDLREKTIRKKEERIQELLGLLSRYTNIDFTRHASGHNIGDEVDVLAAAFNAMADELKAQEAILQTFFRHTADGVLVVDKNGIICEWYPAAARIFGWDKQEVIGKNIVEVLLPARYGLTQSDNLKHFFNKADNNVSSQPCVLHVYCKNGLGIEIELTLSVSRPNGDYFLLLTYARSEREKHSIGHRMDGCA